MFANRWNWALIASLTVWGATPTIVLRAEKDDAAWLLIPKDDKI
jgi:hypothetical protein